MFECDELSLFSTFDSKAYKYSFFIVLLFSLLNFFISFPAFADTSSVDEIVIEVPVSCSLESTGNTSHTATIANGNSTANIGTTTLKAYCNDDNGFAIYAIGYTDNIEGKNVLTSSTLGSDYDIITGTTMSGTSKWAMKLATSGTATYPITLQNNFNNYHDVPDDYTLVAKRTAGTDTGTSATGASLTTTYEAYISTTQPAGTYVGQVKYTLVHPNNAPAPTIPLTSVIASMSKGTQAAGDLKDVITVPTSSNPATDTSNSGVFLYDASLYGTASDASNNYPIYYYRGVLDSDLDGTTSTYGSNGDGAYYPNYVILSNSGTPTSTDTCWRIVRTTGSGGVKMIYNGYYGATNTNSCANSQANAATTYKNSSLSVPFNTTSSSKAGKTYTGLRGQNIHAVGYTYSNLADQTTTATAISDIFGNTGNDIATNANSSIIKKYIEDWYDANLSSYTSILEPDAGFCSDRTVGQGAGWTTPMSDSDTLIPYGTSGMTQYYFGSYIRNQTTGDTKKPTLSCPRGTVDIYSTSDATGGNKQLSRPIALLTADEVAFAGNGKNGRTVRTAYSSNYSYNSFLRSGSTFYLLSPYSRTESGNANGFVLYSNAMLSYTGVTVTGGVRPAISLKLGTSFASGSGTATDPWVVVAP